MRRTAAWTLLAALLAGAVLGGRWLEAHDWGFGRERTLLALLLGAAALLARSPAGRLRLRARGALLALWLPALWLTGQDLRTGLASVAVAARTGEIRIDQGQNTLRAARLLRTRGEDPYGEGQLLDLEAWGSRERQRAEAGLRAPLGREAAAQARAAWWDRLDPAARAQLLPAATAPAARAEARLYGYKYGPLLPLVTLPLEAVAGPAAVPALQLVLYLAWLLLLLAVLRAAGAEPAALPLLLCALSLEGSAAKNFLFLSTSDVWVLAACAGGVLAALRGARVALGLCAAAALGCKAFPAALLLPLVWVWGGRAGWLALGGGLCALYLPFLAWDAAGLWANLARWPSAMAPDSTGWLSFLAPAQRAAARGLAGAALLVACAGYARLRPALPFGWLAFASALGIAAGPAFHGNYAPWVVGWGLCAVLAAFFVGPPGERGLEGSTGAGG